VELLRAEALAPFFFGQAAGIVGHLLSLRWRRIIFLLSGNVLDRENVPFTPSFSGIWQGRSKGHTDPACWAVFPFGFQIFGEAANISKTPGSL
jgi:hypothetical protein